MRLLWCGNQFRGHLLITSPSKIDDTRSFKPVIWKLPTKQCLISIPFIKEYVVASKIHKKFIRVVMTHTHYKILIVVSNKIYQSNSPTQTSLNFQL
jgi:hypothetical protein